MTISGAFCCTATARRLSRQGEYDKREVTSIYATEYIGFRRARLWATLNNGLHHENRKQTDGAYRD